MAVERHVFWPCNVDYDLSALATSRPPPASADRGDKNATRDGRHHQQTFSLSSNTCRQIRDALLARMTLEWRFPGRMLAVVPQHK